MPLLGRDRELGVLRGLLSDAQNCRPRLVLCSGEPGIGKTRLAEELAALAAASGLQVAWGRGFEEAPPFWPWRQLLRALSDAVDLGAVADEHRLRTGLSVIAPEIFGAAAPSETLHSREQRFVHLDAIARLIHHVAGIRALALFIDDAHATDQGSLLLLQHVARTLTGERLLIVVTYRDTDARMRQAALDLLRDPRATAIPLAGLSVAEVAAMTEMITGTAATDADIRALHASTGGNPFFVSQSALSIRNDAACRSGVRVAPSITDSVAERMRQLSPPCRRLLTAGAVLGAEFRPHLAAAIVGERPESCYDAVDEASLAGLIEPGVEPSTYRFTHALVRDAIEDSLASAERVHLHRAAIGAIDSAFAANIEPHLFELAHHWTVAAGCDARAAAECIGRAADEADRRSAFEESAELFRRALSVGGGVLSAAERCQLLLGLAAAAHGAADLDARLDACVQAAAIAREIDRADLLAEAALILEGTFALAPSNLTARRLCEEALASTPQGALTLRARLTARFATVCTYLGDVSAAQSLSRQALELAEESGDPAALDDALHGRQMACDGPDGLAEREALAARLLQLAMHTHVVSRELWARLWRVDACFERGDLRSAARELELLASLADEMGGPWPRWEVLRGLAALAQAQARFAEARRVAREALQVMAHTGDAIAPIPYAAVLQNVGHHTGQDRESLAASGIGDGPPEATPFLLAGATPVLAAALLLLESDRAADAEGLYRALGPPVEWRPHPHGTLAAFSMGLRVAVGLRRDDDVAKLCALLEPFRGMHAASGAGAVAYWGPVELALGIGAHHLGDFARAVNELQDAMRACAVSGADGFRVEAEVELAETLARHGNAPERERAASLAGDAVREAGRLGMPPFAERARAVLREVEKSHPATTLTRREREVAELIAQGLSNSQIAAQLVLSPRTAQTHVQHVLDKLAMDNRAQVAVWVTAQKLRSASQ